MINQIVLYFLGFLVYYAFVSHYIDQIGENYYSTRVSNGKTNPKVYDVFHKFLPDWSEHRLYNDLFAIGFLIPLLFKPTVIIEYLGFWIPIFVIRSLFNLVTILPKNKNCQVNNTFSFRIKRTCYDKVFSGHFSSFLLAALLYLKYNWISLPSAVSLVSLNAFSILVTRSHYTIDILVALVVTLLVYTTNFTISH
jgi:hypothetical protein